jgi:serine protease AprX
MDVPLRGLAASKAGKCSIILQLKPPPGHPRGRYGWAPGDADTVRSLRARVQALKGKDGKEFHSIRAIAAELPAAALDALSQDPRVERLSKDWPILGHMDMVDLALGASQARSTYGLDGSGVGVAVIDSGIHPHADFCQSNGTGSRIAGWVDLVNGQTTPYDDHGHGTHVAGIIGGNGWSSTGGTRTFRGIAPNCNLIGVKALDSYNSAPVSRIISAVQWCIDNRTTYNIRVINLSMGHAIGEPVATDPLCAIVRQAIQNNIVVCCSAGNRGYGGYGTVGVPGNTPECITVGAIKHLGYSTRSYHRLCDFSSRGPTLVDHCLKPDVVSVGNRIISLRVPGCRLDNWYTWNRVPPSAHGGGSTDPAAGVYFTLSGTSMATPTVAGCAALMVQKEPSCSPATVKARIMKTSEKVTWVNVYGRGCGYLDIPGALACTDVATSALSPTCTLNGDGTVSIDSVSFPLDSSIWSLLYCLGVNYAWGENNCSGESAMWGSEGLSGENFAAGEVEVSGYGEN